uniref:Uncharacterized protein n=1 Tax=Mus musculus TaxID=10090 RepID=Q8C728_MOUSE|nr:unnamed protein product [Mus musculus]
MSGPLASGTCSDPEEVSDLKSPLSSRFREPLTHARFQELFGGAEPEPELPAEPCLPCLCRLRRRRASACSGPGAWPRAAGTAAPAALAAPIPLASLAARRCCGWSNRGRCARAPGRGFCPPDLGAPGVRTLHVFLSCSHLQFTGHWETPVHWNFRSTQSNDRFCSREGGARTPRGEPQWNRKGATGSSESWGGSRCGLREWGANAGDVRAAAWCPVHLSIGACDQGADQRGRAARAGVPAAKPLGIVSPTPDRLLFSLQDAGRGAQRPVPEQSCRSDHLGTQPGVASASQGTKRAIPGQATYSNPRRSCHGASGYGALLHLFPGHKIQCPGSGTIAWRISPTPPPHPG